MKIMANPPQGQGERRWWLDSPSNVTKIAWTLAVVCGLLLTADAFYHKHAPFGIEDLFGFYALFGFVAYVSLIFLAKGLRVILMRPEDYYDRDYRGEDSAPGHD
jgi:hypothetical protein